MLTPFLQISSGTLTFDVASPRFYRHFQFSFPLVPLLWRLCFHSLQQRHSLNYIYGPDLSKVRHTNLALKTKFYPYLRRASNKNKLNYHLLDFWISDSSSSCSEGRFSSTCWESSVSFFESDFESSPVPFLVPPPLAALLSAAATASSPSSYTKQSNNGEHGGATFFRLQR